MLPRVEVVEREERTYWIINCNFPDLNSFAQAAYQKLEPLILHWLNIEGSIFLTSTFFLRFRVNQSNMQIVIHANHGRSVYFLHKIRLREFYYDCIVNEIQKVIVGHPNSQFFAIDKIIVRIGRFEEIHTYTGPQIIF